MQGYRVMLYNYKGNLGNDKQGLGQSVHVRREGINNLK